MCAFCADSVYKTPDILLFATIIGAKSAFGSTFAPFRSDNEQTPVVVDRTAAVHGRWRSRCCAKPEPRQSAFRLERFSGQRDPRTSKPGFARDCLTGPSSSSASLPGFGVIGTDAEAHIGNSVFRAQKPANSPMASRSRFPPLFISLRPPPVLFWSRLTSLTRT